MAQPALPDFGKQFLGEVDRYLKEHWQTVTGNDLFQIYMGLLRASQALRGNSSGWTGLAPFLLLRVLYFQLGGAARQGPGESAFSTATGDIRFGESLPVTLGFQSKRPDMALFRGDKLLGALQIKEHLGKGVEELLEAAKLLEAIRFAHDEMRGVLVCFPRLPEQGQMWFDFTRSKGNRGWLDLLLLEGNKDRIADRLRQGLALDRLKNE